MWYYSSVTVFLQNVENVSNLLLIQVSKHVLAKSVWMRPVGFITTPLTGIFGNQDYFKHLCSKLMFGRTNWAETGTIYTIERSLAMLRLRLLAPTTKLITKTEYANTFGDIFGRTCASFPLARNSTKIRFAKIALGRYWKWPHPSHVHLYQRNNWRSGVKMMKFEKFHLKVLINKRDKIYWRKKIFILYREGDVQAWPGI